MILFVRLLIAATTGVLVWAFLASRGSEQAFPVATFCSLIVLLAIAWRPIRPAGPDDRMDISA